MRKLLSLVVLVALVTAGLGAWSPVAQAADTGNAAPQPGKIVSDEPGTNAPNILDGTVYSIAKVGNTIVVGGEFTQVRNFNTSSTLTRLNVLAFDATTGRVRTSFAPDPLGTVFKVLPTGDGQTAYVAGGFDSAAGKAMSSRLFKIDVTSGVIDSTFAPPTISGTIRDLELVGNRLYIAGKFTHINGVAQKALGSLNATTGARDPYMSSVIDGLHNNRPGAVTSVQQISVNKQNTRLMAVGNFTSVDTQPRSQIVQLDISGAAPTVTTWNTNLYTSTCSAAFETYVTDVEYSPNGQFFIVSTTGAWGGASGSMAGTSGCDVVARFESSSTTLSPATWTAYTGGDTTWTVEVTDNVVYAGGHQRWQNNSSLGNNAGQGAVSREGIAALNPVNGLPYSWNPTRERGVGVQDMLATNDGLYVGSDTDLFGHTAGNMFHARIAVLPLAGGSNLPQQQATALPANLYRVASGGSTLTRRSFTGTTAGTATTAPSGPGWGTSTGAFMVNGVLYKTNSDGSLSRMTFDGTSYGTASAVNTSDAIVVQTDWHNDAKTLTSLFYNNGFIYYTKSGVNALYRRSFEVESGVIGQQRFSTTTGSVNWSNTRGAFIVGNKLYFANTSGNLYTSTWNPATHNIVTLSQVTTAGTGWGSRAMFPFQAVPAPLNEPPVVAATVSCDELTCTFNSAGTTDAEGDAVSYDWDFGDGTAHANTDTATHTYANAGDRVVTLVVTDAKGATSSVTRTASPTNDPDNIAFVAKASNSGNRTNHSITVPGGTQVGDTLLLFFAGNATTPVYTGPSGWQQVLSQNGSGAVGRLYSKTATAGDLGSTVTITSKKTDGTDQFVRSDMTLASYRGLASQGISASAITAQNTSNAVHQTPTVTAPDGSNWLVSFWTDKASSTATAATTWAGPPSQTQRSLGTATGTSHMSSLLMDSGGRVNVGAQGGLNATSSISAVGLTMSVLLSPASAPTGNAAPTATASQVSCTDLTCSFDGGSSTDPDGDQLTYDWNWGDGTDHGTTATPSHTFTSAGNKTVTLTVSDPLGATGTATVTGTPTAPANRAPTAAITNAGCASLVCSVDGSTSSDPDLDTLTYSWDFGDNTDAATTANPSHAYTSEGEKTVTLTVTDEDGLSATATVKVNPTIPPNTAPTARISGVNCTDLTCSFSGDTSTDPDNDTLTYSWNFGDSSPLGSGDPVSHDYTAPGAKTVTLTVDDGKGHTATDTATANPTDPNAVPVSHVAFVAANSSNGNRLNHSTTLPGGVQTGDRLIAFFTANSTSVPITGPAGWTLLETKDGNSIAARAWTKTATVADTLAGARVTVTTAPSGTFTGYVKSDLTVAAYRGLDGTTPIAASASKTDDAAGATHVSPAVTATDNTSWLVTYWADRADNTTGWTAPASQTVRQAVPTGLGTSHITALLTDGNGPVSSGANGQLTATANSTSSRGASFSILLKSS